MFVKRDKSGKVHGLFACEQPGFAEEELRDDDPEVLAYLAPKQPVAPITAQELHAAMLKKGGIPSMDEVLAERKA